MPSQTWSIIIFCFNEEKTVGQVIIGVQSLLKTISQQGYQIIIVDDGSTDKSSFVIKKAKKKDKNIQVVTHKKNLGIGKALLSGYKLAKCDNVCAIPADGQFDSKELVSFSLIPKRTFVSFFREANTSYSVFRNTLSLINKIVNKIFLGVSIKDVNWVKIYKNKDLKKLKFELSSSLIETEICAKLVIGGINMIEVKSTYYERTFGKSKGASLKIILQAAKETVKLIKIINRYKYKKHILI